MIFRIIHTKKDKSPAIPLNIIIGIGMAGDRLSVKDQMQNLFDNNFHGLHATIAQ